VIEQKKGGAEDGPAFFDFFHCISKMQ